MLVFLALLIVAGCGSESGESGTGARTETTPPSSGLATVTIEASDGQEVEVRVEIADIDAERTRGLMERTALGENRGMLFVFDDERTRSFWMKNTLIPLSIAYIDADGRIVDIQKMEPLDDDPPHYTSAGPAQYALEVNQGFFEKRRVEVGDRVDLPVG